MKKLFALLISTTIMVTILARIDLEALGGYLANLNLGLMVLAMLLFIPQILLFSLRWKWLMSNSATITYLESTKLTLAASSLNLVLPSKMGDFTKGYFLNKKKHLPLRRGINLVLIERYIDLMALGLMLILSFFTLREPTKFHIVGLTFALIIYAAIPVLSLIVKRKSSDSELGKISLLVKIKQLMKDTRETLSQLKKDPIKPVLILVFSAFIWVLQIFQFYVIFMALKSDIAIGIVYQHIPFCILAGLLPMTVAGIGTRDAAILYFFSPIENTALLAGVGIFASFRYILPGLCGLPLLSQYIVREPLEEPNESI